MIVSRCLRGGMLAVLSLATWIGILSAPAAVRGDVDEPPAANTPFAVISAASVERLLSDVDTLFEAADRPELSEVQASWLARMRDLKGIDRNRPLGMLVYFRGIFPQVVSFLPVENLEHLLQTLTGPLTPKMVEEDLYELTSGRQKLHLRVQDGYAFISRQPELVEGLLPDPVKLTRSLTGPYDIAAEAYIQNLPELTRTIVLDFLHGAAEANLQQFDNETEADFRLRRALGRSNLRLLDGLITDGDALTLGWTISNRSQQASLELTVRGRPGKEIADSLGAIRGTPSRFSSWKPANSALRIDAGMRLADGGGRSLREILRAIRASAATWLSPAGSTASDRLTNGTYEIVDILLGMLDGGEINSSMNLIGSAGGPYTLVGALHVPQGERFGSALTDILTELQQNAAFKVKLAASETGGITFHQLQMEAPPAWVRQLFGEECTVHLGSGPSTVWFALGTDEALPQLRKAMAAVASPDEAPAEAVPLRISARASRWLTVGGNSGIPAESALAPLLAPAFSSGQDQLELELVPQPDGLRLRLNIDRGFLRLVGLALARQIDNSL